MKLARVRSGLLGRVARGATFAMVVVAGATGGAAQMSESAPYPGASYAEAFDALPLQSDPPGWFDSAPGNPSQEAPGLYKVLADPLSPPNRTFAKQSATDSFTHLRSVNFDGHVGFHLSGRMLRTHGSGAMGVTFFSSYPTHDRYFAFALGADEEDDDYERAIARADVAPAHGHDDEGAALRLSAHQGGEFRFSGTTNSHVTMTPNLWYRFRIEYLPVGGGFRIRARAWRQDAPEPSSWPIDATTRCGPEVARGWIGLWAKGPGAKHWDDLNAVADPSPGAGDHDPPTIQITNAGVVIADNAAFRTTVRPVIAAADASPPIAIAATLNGTSFTSGSAVTAEGTYVLAVAATDAAHNTRSQELHFTVDLTAPRFVSTLPADGFLTPAAAVSIQGQVDGAAAVSVDGVEAMLAQGHFSAGPFPLAEGDRNFLLSAVDSAGNQTQQILRVTRDSQAPTLSLQQPTSLVNRTPVLVAGTVQDVHPLSVTVNGRAASLVGASFSLNGVALVEGDNGLQIDSTDGAGNHAQLLRTVTLDSRSPVVRITESGADLVDGALFARPVVLAIGASDPGGSDAPAILARLDGAEYRSGTVITDQGAHLLEVVASDRAGNTATAERRFTIDTSDPEFVALQPGDGSLFSEADVTVTGQVRGAVSLAIDGVAVTLEGELFRAGPYHLSEGDRTFVLLARDQAGNTARTELHVTLDSQPPVLNVTSPAAGSVLATSSVTIQGTVADAHPLDVRINGSVATLVGAVFRSQPIVLQEGVNDLAIEARDAAGHLTRKTHTLTLDTTAPGLRITDSGVEIVDGTLFSRVVTPVIEATDPSPVTLAAKLDGMSFTSGTAVRNEGVHELLVTATDAAGNAASRRLTFRIDIQAPTFEAVAPQDGTITADTSVTIRGRAHGATGVTVDGAAATLVGDDFTSGPFALAEGERAFTLVATDDAANRVQLVIKVTSDRTAPVLAFTQPLEAALVGTSAVNVSGTISEPHLRSLSVNGIKAAVTGTVFLATGVNLAEGQNVLVARAEDSAGNAAEARRSIELDNTAPIISIADPAIGTITGAASLDVHGSAHDAHLDRVEINGLTASLQGESWTITVPLREGTNNLLAKATDRLGHVGQATVAVERDSAAPRIDIVTPADGARLRLAQVAVAGTTEAGASVTVNGVAATVSGASFSTPVIPLVEGENRLIARARDPQHNEGAATRIVIVDTVRPALVESDPALGSLSLRADTVFRLTFSEAIRALPGDLHLSQAGLTVPIAVDVADTVVTVRPIAPLPGGADVTISVGAGVVDLAGNPVSPSVLSFHTADSSAPTAPIVDDLPSVLCADVVPVTGRAEAGSRVTVSGGAAAVETRADGAGRFAVDLALRTNATQRLEVRAIDSEGNVSPAAFLDLQVDCQAPTILDAQRSGSVFRVVFSEPMDSATIAGALEVDGKDGVLPGEVSISANAAAAQMRLATAPPSGPLRLTVSEAVRDRAGNALVSPFVKVFDDGGATSFLSGTILDDATGRPLTGSSVRVISTDGDVLPAPQPGATVAADGSFQVPVRAGTHDLVLTRTGYTPVFRVVTAGPGAGVHILDPRLTPKAAATVIGPLGGLVPGSGGARLLVSAGALENPTPVSLTVLEQQALPALLPYGWSPRGAVWVDAGGQDLRVSSTLSLPVDASDGTNLVLVALEPSTVSWRVLAFATATAGRIEAALTVTGGLAAIEADAGSLGPPAAVVGDSLGSATPPGSDELASAQILFEPPVVLPSQVSLATVRYALRDSSGALVSGSPVTLYVTESLTLIDGSRTATVPFHADLLVYRSAADDPFSRFRLRPSDAAGTLPLRLGTDDVAVVPYGGESVRGNVLGPDGGEVVDADGDTVRLAPGALSEPTAVRLDRLSLSQAPLGVPPGLDAVAVVAVDFGSHELTTAASISVMLAAEPDTRALLLGTIELGGVQRYRPIAELIAHAGGYEVAESTLPWPGLRRGGRYLVARVHQGHGMFYGTIRDVDGSALAGAVIQAVSAPWVQLAGAAGQFVLPAPVGSSRIQAAELQSGNGVEVVSEIAAAGAEVPLDLQLQVVAPQLLASTPPDGATGVPPGVEPTLRFSEALDPLSVAAGVSLVSGGNDVAIDVASQGTLVTIHPRASLTPGADFELRVSGALRDLQGNGLKAPSQIHFTTQQVLLNKDIDLSKIVLYEPDLQGRAHVQGAAGAAPYGTLVFVENRSRLASTVSVQAARDGSFALDLEATVTDSLLLHVVLAGSNALVLELTPFQTQDRHGAYLDQRACRFATADGIAISVDAGTFDGPAVLRVTPSRVEDWHAPHVPDEFRSVAGLELSLLGPAPKKGLHVSVPAPPSAPAGAQGAYLLAHMVSTSSGNAWMIDDQGRMENGRLTTEIPTLPTNQSQAERQVAAVDRRAEDQSTVVLPGMFVPGGSARVAFWHVEQAIGWLTVPFSAGQFEEVVNRSFDDLVVMIDAALSRILGALERVSLPARLRSASTLVLRDPLTGFERSQVTLPGPQNPGDVVQLRPDQLGDDSPPYPLSASPLRLEILDLGDASTGDLTGGIHYEASDGGLHVVGAPGPGPRGVRVTLQSLEADAGQALATTGPDGSFSFTLASRAHRFLLAMGAHVRNDEDITLSFSEALGDGFPGIVVVDGDGKPVAIDVAAAGTRETAVIRARSGWRVGVNYRLVLGPGLADAAGNAWGKTVEVRFDVEAGRSLGSYSLTEVHDMARLGSLLFVAAGSQGLAIVDAGDPAHLASYLPDALTLPFPLGGAVRAVAIDPHGRVIVAGAGDTSPGQVKIVDPLRIDREAIAADPNRRLDAYVGSTIVSNFAGGNIDLPSGSPRRLAVVSDDDRKTWSLGDALPSGLTAEPATPGPGDSQVILRGTGVQGHPVTLMNLTRGRWARVDADAAGHFEVSIKARGGDRLELIANRHTIAYVAVQGVGVAVVDVDSLYHRVGEGSRSDVLGIYTGAHDASLSICGATLPELGSGLVDMAGLFDPRNSHPITLATLALQRGLVMLESQSAAPGELRVVSTTCAPGTDESGRNVVAVVALPQYGFDLNGSGSATVDEVRDYLLVAHANLGLLVYDVTDRANPLLVSQIKLPGAVSRLAVDRERGLAYVSGYAAGVYVVSLRGRLSTNAIDTNSDGRDDRLLETLAVGDARSVLLVPELGIGIAGGAGKVSTIAYGAPELRALSADGTSAVERLAPLGTPTRKASGGEAAGDLPAAFVLDVALPRSAGTEFSLDVAGVGPGGEAVQEASADGSAAGLPRVRHEGGDAIVLRRQAESALEDGFQHYRSDALVAVADLRAARAYARGARERESCTRCDGEAAGVPPTASEILSGDQLAIRFPEAGAMILKDVYSPQMLASASLLLASVRWDTAPSVRQEPALNPAEGSGDELGVLLHSGEFRASSTDLVVKGRGIDFAFARTYRSQTVGNGPLGPGWDFGYHERLRELPNGDVELFDGRGRRETFLVQGTGYSAPRGWFVELQRTAAGWVLVDAPHNVARFDRYGRLQSLADAVKRSAATGNEMRFYYDPKSQLTRIVDSLGRSASLAYDASGLLRSLRDFDQREVDYAYDAGGRLQAVTSPKIATGETAFPAGLTTRYEYRAADGDLAHRLTGRDDLSSITDPRGTRWLQLSYRPDVDGRPDAVDTERWGSGTVQIDYDFDGHAASVTDRQSNTTRYAFDAVGHATRVEDPSHAVTATAFDEEGLATQVTAPLGRVVAFRYDTAGGRRARGNVLTASVTPDSRGANGSAATLTTSSEYDPVTNQPTRTIDPRGTVTTIVRDGAGLAQQVIEADGTAEASTTTLQYNAFGQIVRKTNPNGHAETFEYFQVGPSVGYLHARTIDPEHHAITTRFETDARGNVLATIDPRGVRNTRQLNEVGWVVASTEAASATQDGAPALGYKTTYRHDENGNVIEERLPFGETGAATTRVSHRYGPLNEVLETQREIAPGGAVVSEASSFDANLNLVASTDGEGNVTRQSYDSRNLVERVESAVGTPDVTTQRFSYDAEGSRISTTDGNGHTALTFYDGYGRVSESRDALGNRSTMAYDNGGSVTESRSFDSAGVQMARSGTDYDRHGRPIARRQWLWDGDPTSAREVVARTEYDAAGNVTATTDANGHTTRFERDSAERRTATEDAVGNRTEVELDAAGNTTLVKTREKLPDGSTAEVRSTFSYDANGRRVRATDALGNTQQTAFDARGNVIQEIDPLGQLTVHTFDGLDRRTTTTRPMGIAIAYGYDKASRLTTYTDALGNQTQYVYDALSRRTSTRYPDGNTERTQYDAASNPIRTIDAAGTAVDQDFDAANRLTARTVHPAAGVVGPMAETYTLDGLGRTVRAQSGALVETRTYDSLSRVRSETVAGKTTRFAFDDAGNTTSQGYSSGVNVARTYDALNRPRTIAGAAGYEYRGADLVATKTLANGISGALLYDGARRLIESQFKAPSGLPYAESLSWTPRNQKASESRGDQSGAGFVYAYDDASRLVQSTSTAGDPSPNNQVPATPSGPDQFSFRYDAAQNLLEQTTRQGDLEISVPLPTDGSGRNRPGAAGATPLVWDANGNLMRKGDETFHYDYRNRLTSVERSGDVLASYTYDTANRRILRAAGGHSEQTVWGGWQSLEMYRDGALSTRRTYGVGLDEIVKLERDTNGDGSVDVSLTPLYDSGNHVIAVADASGKTVERYEYTPYGQRRVLVDSRAPRIEQVRVAGGVLILEASEELSLRKITAALGAGELVLSDLSRHQLIPLTATQPIQSGRLARRRLLLALGTPAPAPGTPLRLRIEPTALEDTFQNHAEAAYERDFTWTDQDQILDDSAAPQLITALQVGKGLRLQFSEEIDLTAAAAAITVDGARSAWTLLSDRYTLASVNLLDGPHTLTLTTSPLDLSGKGVTTSWAKNLTISSGPLASSPLYDRPDDREVATSATGNDAGFQGLDADPVTGLVYMRNRWYDPELGRFITKDPLGYPDGPNGYAFVEGDPVNGRDPSGLYEEDFHYYVVRYMAYLVLGSSWQAERIAFASQFVDDFERGGEFAWGTSPVPRGEPWIALTSDHQQMLQDVHFLDRCGGPVRPGEENEVLPQLEARVIETRRAFDLEMQTGILLHSLADTFAHMDFSGQWTDFNNTGSEDGLAEALPSPLELGHGEAGHAPDQPFRRPGVAARAAIEVLHTLKRIFGSSKSIDERRLFDSLRAVFAANRSSARDVGWFYTMERSGTPVDWYDRNTPPGAESIQSYRRRFYSQMTVYRSWSHEAQKRCGR